MLIDLLPNLTVDEACAFALLAIAGLWLVGTLTTPSRYTQYVDSQEGHPHDCGCPMCTERNYVEH